MYVLHAFAYVCSVCVHVCVCVCVRARAQVCLTLTREANAQLSMSCIVGEDPGGATGAHTFTCEPPAGY